MSVALTRIIEYFELIVKFMNFMSNSVFELISSLPKWITFFKVIIVALPDVVLPFVVAGFFISILLLLVGRGG